MPSEPGKPHEEYLLYVRVPDPEDQDHEQTLEFLRRIASLLTDDDEHIYVEPAADHDGTQRTRGKHGAGGIKERGEDRFHSAVGTDANGLGPMYFCHNKY